MSLGIPYHLDKYVYMCQKSRFQTSKEAVSKTQKS
jgi:hypothetical protein